MNLLKYFLGIIFLVFLLGLNKFKIHGWSVPIFIIILILIYGIIKEIENFEKKNAKEGKSVSKKIEPIENPWGNPKKRAIIEKMENARIAEFRATGYWPPKNNYHSKKFWEKYNL